MPTFKYKAVNLSNGQIVKGSETAKSLGELKSRLTQQELELIKADEAGSKIRLEALGHINFGWVNRAELIEFSNNMGMMQQAGVPLSEALSEVSGDQANKYFQDVLNSVHRRIQGGESVADAMRQFPKVFPSIYSNIVEIGENTGRLDTVFFELAKHYKRIDDLVKNARKAMVYPSVLVFVLIGISVFFVMKVFPSIIGFIEEIGSQELPLMTRIFMNLSDFFLNYWVLVVLGLVGFVFFLFLLRRIRITRYALDWLQLHFPYVRDFFIHLRMSFFSRYLALMQAGGVDIIKSLDLSIPATSNLVMEKRLIHCRNEVEKGASLSETLRESRLIPRMLVRMISVGERAGTLPQQLDFVANNYDEILERKIGTFLTLIEPLLIIVLAGMVLSLIGAIFLPIYDNMGNIMSNY